MTTYEWVAIGMLAAGIGGALATWGSMVLMSRGLETGSTGVLADLALAALGGVLAALCGGIASIGRGQKADHEEMTGGWVAMSLGLGVFAGIALIIVPTLLFLFVLMPLWGLAALLGGLAALAALWTVLWLAGIRDESDLAMPFRGAVATPLSKAGVFVLAISLVLPLFWPEGRALSGVIFVGGVLLCGTSLVLRCASRFRERGSNVIEPSDAADSR